MSVFLFILLAGLCGLIFIAFLKIRGGIYQYPLLAATVMIVYVLPEFYGLLDGDYPRHAMEIALFVMITSLFGIVIAFEFGKSRGHTCRTVLEDSHARLLLGATVLVLIGSVSFFMISRLPEESLTGQWSGLPVAYRFFALCLTYGFAMGWLLYLRHRGKWLFLVLIVAAVFLLDRILIAGRRGIAVEFLLIVMMGLWFVRKWQIPRYLAVAAIPVGAIFLGVMVSYRTITTHGTGYASLFRGDLPATWTEVRAIDPLDPLRATTLGWRGSSAEALIYYVHSVSKSGFYDFGLLYHWNGLVNNFVPAQITGTEFKQSLIVGDPAMHLADTNYRPPTGVTGTGFSDAFRSFWYLGFLKFCVIAYVMGILYCKATNGDFRSQLYYLCLQGPALLAITHQTQAFLTALVHMAVFIYPFLLMARRRSSGSWPWHPRVDSEYHPSSMHPSICGQIERYNNPPGSRAAYK